MDAERKISNAVSAIICGLVVLIASIGVAMYLGSGWPLLVAAIVIVALMPGA